MAGQLLSRIRLFQSMWWDLSYDLVLLQYEVIHSLLVQGTQLYFSNGTKTNGRQESLRPAHPMWSPPNTLIVNNRINYYWSMFIWTYLISYLYLISYKEKHSRWLRFPESHELTPVFSWVFFADGLLFECCANT